MTIEVPKFEDSAAQDAGSGNAILVKRNDVLATEVGADDDFAYVQQNSEGALYTEVQNPARVSNYNASLTATGTVDAGANRIHSINYSNADASTAHTIKVYDKATAADENDTPIWKGIALSNTTLNVDFGNNPLEITNGISLRATAEHADSGTTAASANESSATLQLDS